MKYIIDIPDEYENDYISMSPLVGKEFCYPIRNMNKTYVIPTGLKIEPYTEPDRKTIENEVWGFASMLMNMHHDVAEDIYWSMNGGKGIEVAAEMTYQEAKSKYEAWKKQEDEIRVGDEVILPDKTKGIIMNRDDDDCVVINKDSYTIVYHVSELRNAGRHHDCIVNLAEVLKRYRDAV